MPFPCASTAFVAKSVLFLAVLQSVRRTVADAKHGMLSADELASDAAAQMGS